MTTLPQQDTLAAAPTDQEALNQQPHGADRSLDQLVQEMVAQLEEAFEQPFLVLDVETGHIVQSGIDSLNCDVTSRLALGEEIARRHRPEILDECAPLVMLAVPIVTQNNRARYLAISTFITEPIESERQLVAAAAAFGVRASQAYRWAQHRVPWHPRSLLQFSEAIVENLNNRNKLTGLKTQLANVSSHLLNTFEEITLLHRLTQHLSLSSTVAELCELAVSWLSDVVPAECIAIRFIASVDTAEEGPTGSEAVQRPSSVACGKCPIREHDFDEFIERLGPSVHADPIVINQPATEAPTCSYPGVRELISVPIREGEHVFGWLLAFNHTGKGDGDLNEFGTIEASLMSSVAVILGIHCGNINLYQEQSDFFASVVRALTSAIDAKDPYTCGHSDRVARLAVCLARQLGSSPEELDRIYLSGLLHDIGKIGIDDNVLRKPGPLTAEEFEHIKTHPELGCKILDDIKQLDDVLPVVLHHHEAWDGSGYPYGLKGEDTPYLARIVAVADSIDAMSSDRPYRKGIPEDKLYTILREGAGQQWDPTVIDAAFNVRDELSSIGRSDRQPFSLTVDRRHAAPMAPATPATPA